MFARCHSACVRGVDGQATEVEVHVRRGNPRFDVVGLADTAARESRDRVRSALVHSGYRFPEGHVVVNLAPAGTPKHGASHDLPIAAGILAADRLLPPDALDGRLLFGELALDGRLRPVAGAFLIASTAARRGLDSVVAPRGNGQEAALATDVPVHAPATLAEAVSFLAGAGGVPQSRAPSDGGGRRGACRDFAEVRGQEAVKRSLVVAAAGGHNALLVGTVRFAFGGTPGAQEASMPRAKREKGLGATARPRCAILARVSTEDQHLDVQRAACVREAERRGFEVVEVVEDVGSGRRMEERAGLRRVLELAEAGTLDVVLVAELSRLGRSVRGLADAIDRLSAAGVALVSLRGELDISSATGRLLVGVLSVVAAFEVDLLSERTAAGMDAAKLRGRAVGQAPYGMRWRLSDDEDAPASLEPVSAELETLRRALALRSALGRWDHATAALNAEGRFSRKGRPWRADGLAAACRNPRARAVLDAAPGPAAAVA